MSFGSFSVKRMLLTAAAGMLLCTVGPLERNGARKCGDECR